MSSVAVYMVYCIHMKTKKGIVAWMLIGAAWVAALVLYDEMPDRMATHWNAAGIADGYSGKALALFLLPVIMIAIQGTFVLIPKIDPLKKNIETFRDKYEGFILLLGAFMLYVFALTILWSKGVRFSMTTALLPALAGMFYGIGVLIKDIKRNWFVGIRTPWTMTSDVVWGRTHILGSKLFKLSGAVTLLGIAFPGAVMWFIIVPILASTAATVVYSYIVFKDEKK